MFNYFIIIPVIIFLIDAAFVCFVIGPVWANWDKWQEIPEAPLAILQISIVGVIAEIVLFSQVSGVICPPLAFLLDAIRFWNFRAFLMLPIFFGLVAAAILLITMRKLAPRVKSLAWSLSAAVFCIVTFLVADQRANSLQTEAIAQFAPECVSRSSFWRSIQIAGKEHQFDVHIFARKNGTPFGWSFKELSFYPIPSTVVGNIANECKS